MEDLITLQKQLRQDYLHLLTAGAAPLYRDRAEVNRRYQFKLPEGLCCMFLLRAEPKLQGAQVEPGWLAAAEDCLRRFLPRLEGDFETLLLGQKLICLAGSPLDREWVSGIMQEAFQALSALSCPCWFTLGLGRFVTEVSALGESWFSATHAIKYSIRDGLGRIYDGNRQSGIFEGGLTLLTTSEEVALKRLIQEPEPTALEQHIRALFDRKQPQIQKYPVYAYMLSLQLLDAALQTLREIMPVDRKTYELGRDYQQAVDDLPTLEALIRHVTAGVQALCQRYQLYLQGGRSQPLWLTVTYIQEHYTEPLTLEELARVTDRNPQYLSAVFSRACGMSLKAYITALRVEEAQRLLRATALPIGEIAARTGYQDAKYFSRVFQKSTGQSPTDFRQAQQAPPQAERV